MPGVLLKIVGIVSGGPHELDNRYVVEYDPKIGEHSGGGGQSSGYAGWCHLETTDDPMKAHVFADIREALECWRQSVGLRPDGHPNRPLTAFTVTFAPAPEKKP